MEMGLEKRLSTFNVIISIIAGFLFQCAIYTLMGIAFTQVPLMTVVLMWIAFSTATAVVLSMMGFWFFSLRNFSRKCIIINKNTYGVVVINDGGKWKTKDSLSYEDSFGRNR